MSMIGTFHQDQIRDLTKSKGLVPGQFILVLDKQIPGFERPRRKRKTLTFRKD